MKNLEKQIKLDLSEFHKEKINQIDNFDYSNLVWKLRQENGMSDEHITEGIENLKRYYVVALFDPLNEHAVSELVDPFWHTHILFTKEYISFCSNIFNGYIHHSPLNQQNNKEVSEVSELYNYTIEIYDKIFHHVDENWWPRLNNNSLAVNLVCRHMLQHDSLIKDNALFKTR